MAYNYRGEERGERRPVSSLSLPWESFLCKASSDVLSIWSGGEGGSWTMSELGLVIHTDYYYHNNDISIIIIMALNLASYFLM